MTTVERAVVRRPPTGSYREAIVQLPIASASSYDYCDWSLATSKEKFADLRRRGYQVVDWRGAR